MPQVLWAPMRPPIGFWTVDDTPVAMAAIARRLCRVLRLHATQQRRRGCACSATAAVADKLFAEGKTTVSLYTDLRNPLSNRCYAKIGSRPIATLGIIWGGLALNAINFCDLKFCRWPSLQGSRR